MKRLYSKLIALALLLVIISCEQAPIKTENNPFEGLWSLDIMEQKNPDTGEWEEWKNGMQGYILYDATENMSVHLTEKGYEKTAIRFPNFIDTIPDEALKHLTKSYVYFAKYKVDKEEATVEHARFSHSNPGDWNKVVKRRFTFKGDTLILQPLESANSSLRLTWIKDKN